GSIAPGVTDINGAASDSFRRDLGTKSTIVVSTVPNGTTTGDRASFSQQVSGDATQMYFNSDSTNFGFSNPGTIQQVWRAVAPIGPAPPVGAGGGVLPPAPPPPPITVFVQI